MHASQHDAFQCLPSAELACVMHVMRRPALHHRYHAPADARRLCTSCLGWTTSGEAAVWVCGELDEQPSRRLNRPPMRDPRPPSKLEGYQIFRRPCADLQTSPLSFANNWAGAQPHAWLDRAFGLTTPTFGSACGAWCWLSARVQPARTSNAAASSAGTLAEAAGAAGACNAP